MKPELRTPLHLIWVIKEQQKSPLGRNTCRNFYSIKTSTSTQQNMSSGHHNLSQHWH